MKFKNFLNTREGELIDLKNIIENSSKVKEGKIKMPTGTDNLDDIFQGGLSSGNIYLIFGASNTGKTQFCHQMCIQSIINEKIVYYLDTENTFRAERISELAICRNIKPEKILKNIYVSKIMSSSMLIVSLKDIERKLRDHDGGILLIDTINNHFRVDQGDIKSSYIDVKRKFLKTLDLLDLTTQRFNLISIITAQISSNFLNDPLIREIPVGNQFLNHYISEYLYLRVENEKMNSAHLVNSQYLPEKKKYYKITQRGLENENE